jgi:hypothetical protein
MRTAEIETLCRGRKVLELVYGSSLPRFVPANSLWFRLSIKK